QPTLSINDVSQNEGNSGTTMFNFTVSLSQPAPVGGVTFTVNTADGTTNPATAGSDYVAIVNGGGTITAGDTSTTVSVTVNGDTTSESNETFFVNLSSPTNAVIGDGQGLGTILNDDSVAPITKVVISQVYGGGNNSGATYQNDFIELFNSGNQTVNLSGWSVQNNAAIQDLVGYGSTAATANFCYEGSGPAPAPSGNAQSVLRAAAGCTDTNVNSADFSTATPSARNSSTPLNPCP